MDLTIMHAFVAPELFKNQSPRKTEAATGIAKYFMMHKHFYWCVFRYVCIWAQPWLFY